ncbi:MAG: hypothetical protein Q9173_006898 [Seirophora scorigena]
MADADIPYWCYNIPKEQWPAECPDFLIDLSERDQKLVGRRDQDYERLTWPEVRQVIVTPRQVALLGSLLDDCNAHGTFAGDIKILYNDWPYGIDERIVHLVVWTKFDLPDDRRTKELTAAMRQEIDDYVDRTFCQAVPKENVRVNALTCFHDGF